MVQNLGNIANKELSLEILREKLNYCENNSTNFTPVILINNNLSYKCYQKELPKYSIDDLIKPIKHGVFTHLILPHITITKFFREE
ncbi:hypothetical protein TXIAM_260048 [Tenacibaculum xiamenense]